MESESNTLGYPSDYPPMFVPFQPRREGRLLASIGLYVMLRIAVERRRRESVAAATWTSVADTLVGVA
jgi:hypothetical protein